MDRPGEVQSRLLSLVNGSVLSVTPGTVTHQAPLSREFSRQEYWSAISFSRVSFRPRDRTGVSSIAGEFFTTEPPGKPIIQVDLENGNSRQ